MQTNLLALSQTVIRTKCYAHERKRAMYDSRSHQNKTTKGQVAEVTRSWLSVTPINAGDDEGTRCRSRNCWRPIATEARHEGSEGRSGGGKRQVTLWCVSTKTLEATEGNLGGQRVFAIRNAHTFDLSDATSNQRQRSSMKLFDMTVIVKQ